MTALRRLTHADVEDIRHLRGRSTLLFITDRCPVGCGHCSVDSRSDSPRITDWRLFGEIVDWLCAAPDIEVVGVSGGEPFVERRGLSLVSRKLADAGKHQVVYTSGVWAGSVDTPEWIRDVLRRCACVYLSTDAFHAARVADGTFVNAARSIADAGAWIVVQALDVDRMLDRADALLRTAFGGDYAEHAELRPLVPLTHGRGAGLFSRPATTPGEEFGPCPLVTAQMIRYDGRVSGCCNESVIMNLGPARLRRTAGTGAEVAAAMAELGTDPLLRAIGGVGLGALTLLPRHADLAGELFADQCGLCWKVLAREPDRPVPDPLLDVINATTRECTP